MDNPPQGEGKVSGEKRSSEESGPVARRRPTAAGNLGEDRFSAGFDRRPLAEVSLRKVLFVCACERACEKKKKIDEISEFAPESGLTPRK